MTVQRPSPPSSIRPESQPTIPTTQGKPLKLRSKLWVWIQELPTMSFPQEPDPHFQLIDAQKLDAALKDADPEAVRKIKEDMQFLDYELLRLFRARDHEAKQQQNRYRLYQIGFVILAALAGMIGSFQAIALSRSPDALPLWAFVETVVALIVTYLATISGREPPLPKWLTNRRRAEQLRREYFRYLMNLPPYDSKEGYERQTLLARRAADINRGMYPEEIPQR